MLYDSLFAQTSGSFSTKNEKFYGLAVAHCVIYKERKKKLFLEE
jgi:hypothetical protein